MNENIVIADMVNVLYGRFKDAPEILCDAFVNNAEKPTSTIVRVRDNDAYKLEGLPCQGIYFLMLCNYVCYVGMSVSCIETRIFGSHIFSGHCENKIFNRFKYINLEELSKYEIQNMESMYINMFAPYYNKILNNAVFYDYMPKEYFDNSNDGKVKLQNIAEKIHWNIVSNIPSII